MVKKKTDERRPCIYCARNKITNKYYVGQTRYGLKHRQHQHLDRAYNKKSDTRFCRALRIYGQDSFVWETLYIVRNDDLNSEQLQSLLNMREKAWVKYFNSLKEGYNQDGGGTGGVRYKYATLEEKNKARRLGQKARREARPEFKQQRKEYRRQKREQNPELVERMRERHREYMKQNPELVERMRERHREYMKQNQQKRRSLQRDKINARQRARRAENREAYRIALNERRRKRKENKLNSSN